MVSTLLNPNRIKPNAQIVKLITDELIPAHSEQLRNGVRDWESSTIPGDVVVRVVEKALATFPDLVREALEEARKRYPDAQAGLLWFSVASGLATGEVTEEVHEWAKSVIERKELDIKLKD